MAYKTHLELNDNLTFTAAHRVNNRGSPQLTFPRVCYFGNVLMAITKDHFPKHIQPQRVIIIPRPNHRAESVYINIQYMISLN